MNVTQLINILKELDGDAEICLAVDKFNERDQDWETELIQLSVDDLVLGISYAAFQVPSEREFDDE